MQGASQTAAEPGQQVEVINCRETETVEIVTSTVLPEPMSAVRHMSSRGHGFFDNATKSRGPMQNPADVRGHIKGCSFI